MWPLSTSGNGKKIGFVTQLVMRAGGKPSGLRKGYGEDTCQIGNGGNSGPNATRVVMGWGIRKEMG